MEKKSILTFFISFNSTFFVKKSLSYFLGKLLRKMAPESLLFTAQLELFYQVYNIILLIESNSYHYCFCDKVPGYPENYRIDGWSLICRLQGEYTSFRANKAFDKKTFKIY